MSDEKELIIFEGELSELGETSTYVRPAITKVSIKDDDSTKGETPEVIIKK